jgi:hypothetical protein
MGSHFVPCSFAAFVLAIAWLLSHPGGAEAHPALVGKWRAAAPQGGFVEYDFGQGEYVGFGYWRGPLVISMSGGVISTGTYELRMYSLTEGAVGLRDGTLLSLTAGTIDLGARVMVYMNTTFRP